jgi:hypothetical protein
MWRRTAKTCLKWRTGAGAEIIAKIAKIAKIATHIFAGSWFSIVSRQFWQFFDDPPILL